jgi:hypothetical protein
LGIFFNSSRIVFFQLIKDIGKNQNGILLIQNVQTGQINYNQETINTITSITTAELLLKLMFIIFNVQTEQTNDKQRNMNISFNKNSAVVIDVIVFIFVLMKW